MYMYLFYCQQTQEINNHGCIRHIWSVFCGTISGVNIQYCQKQQWPITGVSAKANCGI